MNSVFASGFLLILCFGLVLGLSDFSLSQSQSQSSIGSIRNEPTMVSNYDRIDEVKKQCRSYLPQTQNDKQPYSKRLFKIKDRMSFVNGDWWQDLDKAPIMPLKLRGLNRLNGSNALSSLDETETNVYDPSSPSNFVSFWVTNVDRAHRAKNSVNVNGILKLGITIGASFGSRPHENNPTFTIYPGHSELSISFQGIVSDTDDSNGETVMCLLGNTMLPYRYPDKSNPWDWVNEPGYINQPPLIQDDQILLVIRYPKTFSLTQRGIYGSLKSLNPKTSQKYFDEVRLSSSLSGVVNYEFSSDKLVSKACTPYPYKDEFVDTGVEMYKGADFCLILERFTGQDFPLTVVPNWKCNGTNEYCSKLGPFDTDASIKATNGSFKGVLLSIQDVRCEEASLTGKNKNNRGSKFTKVAAVIRVVPPSENYYNVAQRSGLNNMTLSVEGMWEASSGQLCMIGCRGIVDRDFNSCDSRICLYIPLSFSIKQRSIIIGTISNVDEGKPANESYFPLAFEKQVRPYELYDQYTASHPSYKYSKIDLAGSVLERHEPFSFGTVIKKSLLTFPKLNDKDSYLVGLSLLSEDLTLHHPAVPDSGRTRSPLRADVQFEILSIGPLFGHYWSQQNDSITEEEIPKESEKTYTEKQLLLNVSGQISLLGLGSEYGNFSSVFVEGLYYPVVGKMYLVGCRDVRASWNVLYDSMDLEDGLDCLIEVVISYPPTTTRWLVNPTARISISSQRNEFDPLFFKSVNLQTVPIMYRAQREDILSRRGVEGMLRVLTLSVGIGLIFSQLFYIKENSDSVPYISIVMLAVQAVGYGIPLVTGAEALFKKSKSYDEDSSVLQKSQMIQVIDYTVKILVLVSFSLTLRIYQKVWRSRIRLLTRAPLEPNRVPSERGVLIVTAVAHALGFISVLVIHSLQSWLVELEEYMGLVQDLFLLPQVIGNIMWQINCKPLRKLYFIGLTIIRLLPHVYDYIRSPIPNPYFSEDYEFVNPHLDFYSKIGDVLIPVTAILLAILVHAQQKLGYEKLAGLLDFGKFRVLPRRSVAYERLSPVVEAEMTSGVDRDRKEVDIE
ncbi:hypothetical protein CTI12_AA411730 [Artemisia annua]|uniref:RING-type E3 ubiquitin transferase n=1 Tax=Artemisia annua TaxID=35608 RepID=A0A2U1M7P3_ARTAN|nr:hypothetical protein CTI12_AA411730 [Artemisia annua]